ncbi:MAG TPA: MFS transporter [Burkholderiales bacterium]|nr:MFS transporter [Burkholderiales bacterium]
MPPPLRLAAFYFAFFLYSGVALAYFPAYLAARGLSAAEIAAVLALPQLVRIFAPAFWGWVADRSGGQRGIVILGCAANAACFALVPLAPGVRGIAALVAAASLLSAAALPLVEAITLGALAGQSGRYGPIRVWGSVGFIVAVLGGGAWLERHAAATLAPALVVFGLASLFSALALPPSRPLATRARPAFALPPAARALLGCGFCMALAHGTLYAFLTLHLQQMGYRATAIGLLWTLGVLAEILVFMALPALFRRARLSAILAASCLIGGLRFLLIGWAAEWAWILAAAQLMHGATFGAFHAASVAAIHRLFPAAGHARGQTLFSSIAYGAGGAAGALFAGWAWELAGPGMAFSISALAALAGVLLAYSLKRAGL